MHTLPASWRVLAAAALLFGAIPSPAAPAPPSADSEAAVNPVEKARQGLDRVVTLKIDKQSLSTAVAMLGEKAKLKIVLDSQSIQQQLGFTPDQSLTAVNADLKEVKARSALRTILAPYGLTFAIVGDAVVVTTEGMAAERQMRQHVSVHFDKIELAAALKQLAHETAVNLSLDPAPRRKRRRR